MNRRTVVAGLVLLLTLFGASLTLGVWFPGVLHDHCPLGRDLIRPDLSVCELSLGGLWVSFSVALLAAALATGLGLLLGVAARQLGRLSERLLLRSADAFFALPDVLVLMVLQLAGQTLGDLNPAWRLRPFTLMVVSLAAVGWAGPARMLNNRLVTLERLDHVAAARALGASPVRIFRVHVWPFLRPTALSIFIARIPAAVLAESTVSFFGIARLEPMSLGRYLGTSYASILYEGGARIVGPAWGLLMLLVLGASLTSRGLQPVP